MSEKERPVIHSVVPEELGPELYDRLAAYYADDPSVEVILDRRRRGPSGGPPKNDESRYRGRRRRRAVGDHPPLPGDAPSAA